MSKAMTFKELGQLLKHIHDRSNTDVRTSKLPPIKYVHPNIDMRTNSVFSISFRGYGTDEVVFITQNEYRNLDKSLYERCMSYLTTGDISTASRVED